MVGVNKLDKQSQTANMGWSSSLGVRWGANNSSLTIKKKACYIMLHGLRLWMTS